MTGSITRATLNAAAGAVSVYFRIPVGGALPDGSSVTTLKTPAEPDDPVDVRLRTKGVVDVKLQDGTIFSPSSQKWIAGQWYRGDLVWTWDATSGQMDGAFYWYVKGNGEYQDADSVIAFSGVTTSPTNYSHGSPNPDDPVEFEVERGWATKVVPGPYGTPPPAPPLNPATTLVRPGVAGNDFLMVSVYTGDAEIFDTISLNVATNSGMTSPTNHTGGAHNSGGFNLFTITSLPSHTRHWVQAVVNGTPRGPIVSAWTTQAAGTPCTIRRAVAGCQQDPPASTAAFDDMTSGAGSWTADRLVHLGDDTYPNSLSGDPFTHWQTYALSMSDLWAQRLAAAGCGVNKIISDHDVNGGWPGGNGPNFNEPATIASLVAWEAAVPAPMADTRFPRHGRYWSEVEGNVRFVYLDQRGIDRTDVRKNGVPPDSATSVMIDPIQEAWLYDEATAAASAGQLLIVFMDSQFLGVSPYATEGNSIPVTYSDKWGSYTVQRDRIDETIAGIMPISDGHPNAEFWSSDGHGLQFGVTPNGIKVRTCGPLHQQLHLHFQSDYDVNYPAGTKGDSYGGGGSNTQKRTQYMRQTIVEFPAGTFTVTAEMRDCSTKVVGDTPATMHTDTTVYSTGGDIVGDHLYMMIGLPS